MPHASLTGFFEEEPQNLPTYIQIIKQLYDENSSSIPTPVIEFVDLYITDEFIGF